VFGLTVVTFLPIVLGGTVSFIPRFSPQATHRAIVNEPVNILMAVPSMYAAIARLKSLEPSQFSRITLAASGGEPLPRTVYEMFFEKTGIRLIEGYGLTETSPIISIDEPWDHQVGTVGKPLPNLEIQVRDAENKVLPLEQEGELCVRGPSIMKGYYNKPQETAAVIDSGGWFRTGDIVRVSPEGHIAITGRAKDLIITGGENVYPREVESVLEEHPAVAEAAVIGQPDTSRGEVVVGVITLKDGQQVDANELRAFCKDRLAGFKIPREIHIRPDLPRGPTGKILKRELKKQLSS
jgi:long-chain acyl-CoA synthetase